MNLEIEAVEKVTLTAEYLKMRKERKVKYM
jgi:hypothetical protein